MYVIIVLNSVLLGRNQIKTITTLRKSKIPLELIGEIFSVSQILLLELGIFSLLDTKVVPLNNEIQEECGTVCG